MRVIDHAGNSLKIGRLLRWQPSPQGGPGDYYVKVTDVVQPTLLEPGKVVLAITFGIKPPAKKDDMENGAVRFADLITVFDPEEELKAEAAVAKAKEASDGVLSIR